MNKTIERFAREQIKAKLALLPTAHQLTFKRMYGRDNGRRSAKEADQLTIDKLVEAMPIDALDWALTQIENSMSKLGLAETVTLSPPALSFEQWYEQHIGITLEDARLRGVDDLDVLAACWEGAFAARAATLAIDPAVVPDFERWAKGSDVGLPGSFTWISSRKGWDGALSEIARLSRPITRFTPQQLEAAAEAFGDYFCSHPFDEFTSSKAVARVMLQAACNVNTPELPSAEGWHAPGLGEIHNEDHTIMIDVRVDNPEANDDPASYQPDYLPSDVLASRLAALLAANPGVLTGVPDEVAAPEEEHPTGAVAEKPGTPTEGHTK